MENHYAALEDTRSWILSHLRCTCCGSVISTVTAIGKTRGYCLGLIHPLAEQEHAHVRYRLNPIEYIQCLNVKEGGVDVVLSVEYVRKAYWAKTEE